MRKPATSPPLPPGACSRNGTPPISISSPGLGTDQCFTATYEVPENGAFWSITMYDATGFIAYENSIANSSNVTLNEDGTFTAFFGSEELCGDVPNRLDTPEGWNFMMRIYLPGPSVLDGSYILPDVVPAE